MARLINLRKVRQAQLSTELMRLTEQPKYAKLSNKEIATVLYEIANEIKKL